MYWTNGISVEARFDRLQDQAVKLKEEASKGHYSKHSPTNIYK